MSAAKAAKSKVPPGVRLSAWLKNARRRYPTNASFAEIVGCSESRLSQILAGSGGRVSPELAIKIGQATDGKVPASAWRPDLWAKAADVPAGAAQ